MDFYKVFEETLSVSGMIEWHRRMTEKILKNERKLTDEDCDEFPDPRISEFAKLLPRIPMQEERLTPDSLYLFQKRG